MVPIMARSNATGPILLAVGVLLLLAGVILGLTDVCAGQSVFSLDSHYFNTVCGQKVTNRAILTWPALAIGAAMLVWGAVSTGRALATPRRTP